MQHDPDHWLSSQDKQSQANQWIAENDDQFKPWLDRYKYPNRFDLEDGLPFRKKAMTFIDKLEAQLQNTAYLLGDHITLVDVAIFPFVRQFVKVDESLNVIASR